jgi:ribosomal protein S18 acetylase RimI-like enzyme
VFQGAMQMRQEGYVSHVHSQRELTHGQATLDRPFEVRGVSPEEKNEVWRLYRDGLHGAQVHPFDPATDLEQMEEFYQQDPKRRLWVAAVSGEVIGTVAIAMEDETLAHLRRLRVAPECASKQPVANALVETAAAHARDQGAIKLVFHNPADEAGAANLLSRLGFQFSRARRILGRRVMEFYVNLYDRIE